LSMTGLPFACGSVPPGTTHDYAIGQAGPSILSRSVTVIDFVPGGQQENQQDVVLLRRPVTG
jgi:hypothetical protein